MLFNSIEFLLFLPITFIVYWVVFKNNIKGQNFFLLFASYVFYGWWDYRFLGLIVASTLVDFFVGRALGNTKLKSNRKWLLGLSITFNIGLLGFFKYYNFFIESWIEAWATIGVAMHTSTLQIILPVGISFYTFQTLSYTIDVYRRKLAPTNDIINFGVYVAFFPQLVAGPIERATRLLPQFSKKRIFDEDQAISGIHLILWGLFKKMVIADSCATYVNVIFNNYEDMNTASLILGAVYFSFQIYGDFSGYSDIAIGTARLFGFDLMRNFNYPYFARDIAEFWRRWHISLSTWFRDYLYIPLGGSKGTKVNQLRNVFIIFLVSGFWHGANWTFIIWGGVHALLFIPLLLSGRNRKYTGHICEGRYLPTLRVLLAIILTFILTTFAWVFFRANSVMDAMGYFKRIFSTFDFSLQYLSIERYNVEMLLIVSSFIVFEWFHRNWEHPFQGRWKWLKITAIAVLLLTLGVYSDHQEFIYFQF